MVKMRIKFIYAIILFLFTYQLALAEVKIKIHPTPKELYYKGYEIQLDSSWTITVNKSRKDDIFTADILARSFKEKDVTLSIKNYKFLKKEKNIILATIEDYDLLSSLPFFKNIQVPEEFKPQGYFLEFFSDRIILLSKDSSGLFYGVQTLRQLISKEDIVSLPAVRIYDYPTIKIRAVHFCGADSKKIKTQLEEIAKLKFNTAIIESWDFFNLSKGKNREVWQDIFKYARSLHIEPVPELQSFGAAGSVLTIDPYAAEGIWVKDAKFKFLNDIAIALEPEKSPLTNIIKSKNSNIVIANLDKTRIYQEGVDYKVIEGDISYPYLSSVEPTKILRIPNGKIKDGEIVLVSYDYVERRCTYAEWSIPYCPSSERTYRIMFRALKDVIRVLKPRYISIGHDEIRGLNRDSRCQKRNLTNAELLADDIIKLNNFTKGLNSNVRLLMWDDMLNPWHNGGDENYQVQFGGKKGKTAPAIDVISKDIIMLLWHQSRKNLIYAPAYFKSKGFDFWVNGAKWLEFIESKSRCKGVIVTTWQGWNASKKDIRKISNKIW